MKKDIRKSMLEKRQQLSKAEVLARSARMVDLIKALPFFSEAKIIGLYMPVTNELDIREIADLDIRPAYPKVEKDGIHFYATTETSRFVKSDFGILEPVLGKRVDDDIDLLLVPAIAISKTFYRIGFGKGYYDDFLQKHRPRHVIGIIYDFQEIDHFEPGPHDQKLDAYLKV
ncbi:MAG: 5-formyltetrahydrofolate cyclo-ligase [Acholeplasmataceae bacterium]|nr:MAG: 5-formyltetrahydrofolate cyclo-ligase [Acholeplasmataceae bacterium]